MKCYKGFDKDLKCRGYQYEIGKSYEEPEAKLCEKGYHACEYPLDVFNYYVPADSRYCEVELDGVEDSTSDDTKRCGTKIAIKAEIGIAGIVKAAVDFTMSKINGSKINTNTGNQSAATNTGDQSAATNTGDRSAATNTGNQSAATNTGNWSAATNTGNWSAATNTGDRSAATNTGNQSAATNTGNQSAATNTGDQSAATNTGNWSAATNTGDRSAATNTGDRSAATVEGKESIAICTGRNSKVKGALGCWIALAEWDDGGQHIIDFKSAKVDGVAIKADVFYVLMDGNFVEAEIKNV